VKGLNYSKTEQLNSNHWWIVL